MHSHLFCLTRRFLLQHIEIEAKYRNELTEALSEIKKLFAIKREAEAEATAAKQVI